MGRWEKNGLGFQGRGAELVEWSLKKRVLNSAFAELKTLGVGVGENKVVLVIVLEPYLKRYGHFVIFWILPLLAVQCKTVQRICVDFLWFNYFKSRCFGFRGPSRTKKQHVEISSSKKCHFVLVYCPCPALYWESGLTTEVCEVGCL